MKNLILIISALLIVFNTLIGLTITNYITISFLLVDLSIALSASIIYFTVFSKIANGYIIGLTVLFFFSGIARCLCLVFAEQVWTNNFCFIVAIGIFLFELSCLASALFASKKQIILKRQTE